MRQFVGIDLGCEPVPDETTVCKFRHLLEQRWETASRSRLTGAGFKPPGAAAFKRRGGERPRKKASAEWCQVSIEEMSESKPSDDASLLPQDTAKTGDDHWLQEQSGRYLFTV